MTAQQAEQPEYDAIVVGAGVCGIYQAYRLQDMGLRFTVLERATHVGGTWHWNRYPGCRFDSESQTYGYSFSSELLQEWNWTERFAPRHETERYLQRVVAKFELRDHMQFQCTVVSARWDETNTHWTVGLADGRTLSTRFLLTALGLLSTPTLPRYPAIDSFEGQSFHTYHFPREGRLRRQARGSYRYWRYRRTATLGDSRHRGQPDRLFAGGRGRFAPRRQSGSTTPPAKETTIRVVCDLS